MTGNSVHESEPESASGLASVRGAGRWRWVPRFRLLTILLLMALFAVAIGGPVSKMLAKRRLEQYNNNESPGWIEYDPYPPRQKERMAKSGFGWLSNWFSIRDFCRIEKAEVWGSGSNDVERNASMEKLANAVLANPIATEDLTSLHWHRELTPAVEKYVMSRRKLKVLELRGTPSVALLESLRRMHQLEVLKLKTENFTDEHFAALGELKWVRWMIVGHEGPQIERLRRQLPNTYIN